ncbi:5-methylcytosine restriction system specificity protein McrC [Psychrobacter sp. SWN149]|uniref:McrC family protein n=1 Tax=Psychrobacter sp. SWN149 TaxID=2792057 RepID=UPI002A0A4160|nr:hypothetical protein [Psychrobacter sp. SWN149]
MISNQRQQYDINYSHTRVDSRFTHSSSQRVITVFEHQRLTVHDFLQVSDFHWLMAKEFDVFTIKRRQGQWQLKVGHYIGIILLPSGMTLEILPKLNQSTQNDDIVQTRHWVQGMLSDLTRLDTRKNRKLPNTKNLNQFSHQTVPLPMEVLPLSDWLVAQFLQRVAGYQPTKQYQTQTNNYSSLQGRLLIKEQLRYNTMQPHKFVCESSVLSPDILANRLIKSALIHLTPLLPPPMFLTRLQPWQRLPTLNQREMLQLNSTYHQAKRQLSIQPLQQKQLQAAQELLDLAYWLLQQSNTATGNGIDPVQQILSKPRLCLLIDMNQAFEQWASLCITEMFQQVSDTYRPLYQTKSVWLNDDKGQACLSIRPDLLIYDTDCDDSAHNQSNNKEPVETNAGVNTEANMRAKRVRRYSHVIDMKWKHLPSAASISANDAYQLTSYAQAYRAGQVWLVYPVLGVEQQPVALKQKIHPNDNSNADSETNGDDSSPAHLWLMPFNVLTGTINGEWISPLNKAQ